MIKVIKTNPLLSFFLIIFLFQTSYCLAAFPINEAQKTKSEQLSTRISKLQQKSNKQPLPNDRSTEKDEDEGVYGILALVLGILGVFPAAIVLGIIGLQRHRKYRGLATAGLVLGIVVAAIFLLAVLIFIALLGGL